MDAVISYVNGCEKVWRTEFNRYTTFMNGKLMWYYDWGTLRYLLRGISVFMPYIKNVFLVVSNIEQVPDYVNDENVHIVLYKDFIPEKYIPTFNPCMVELFMHRIEGLDETFIYFNQNMVPVAPIAYRDLVYDGSLCLSFKGNDYSINDNEYYITMNSFRAACLYVADRCSYSGDVIENPLDYNGPGVGHIYIPYVFFKSKNEDIYNSLEDYISNTMSIEKMGKNISHYLYSDVTYLENTYIGSRLTSTHLNSFNLKEEEVRNKLSMMNTNYLTIYELGQMYGLTYNESAEIIRSELDRRLPRKCRYER